MRSISIIMAVFIVTSSLVIISQDIIDTSVSAASPSILSNYWRMDLDITDRSFTSFIGEEAYDSSGVSVSFAGDVNGDGYDDILIGAYFADDGGDYSGKTYLILGNSTGWPSNLDLSKSDASFIGENELDYSGVSVSGAGDVNGDGYDDILIAAYRSDDGEEDSGQTYLIFGRGSGWSNNISLSNADASFLGEGIGDYSGVSVSGAGDVNGDGYDDILIGAFRNNEGSGDAGQTYLILGRPTGWSMDTPLSSSNASFIGESHFDHSGASVSGAGDVNGDGFDDLLISAIFKDGTYISVGKVYLILGKSSGWSKDTELSSCNISYLGEGKLDYAGIVSPAGDVNGDGFDDFLIGSRYNDEGGQDSGQTYLILGKSTGWSSNISLSSVDASFIGEEPQDRSGGSVSGAGDVNGDGYDDLIIGSEFNSEGSDGGGQTYLIWGRATGWSMDTDLSAANASIIGESGSRSGTCIAGGGNFDGDGYDDFLISAPAHKGGGNLAGKTYVINGIGNRSFGKDETPSSTTTGESLNFKVHMNKELNVPAVYLEYRFNNGSATMVEMTSNDTSSWMYDLVIPSNIIGTLYYNFSSQIKPRFWINTSIEQVEVMDNDIPVFGNDYSMATAYTGDPFEFSMQVTDNVELDSVLVEYWFGEGEPSSEHASPYLNTSWNLVTNVPSDMTGDLYYRYIARDTSGYVNETSTKKVTVIDNDRPWIIVHEVMNATTGDETSFSVNVMDNIDVSNVFIEYWYGDEDHQNITLEYADDAEWNIDLTIENRAGFFTYIFHAVDKAGNWNQSYKNYLNIIDNDDPVFGNDMSDALAYNGEGFTFSVKAEDNIGLSSVHVKYWTEDMVPISVQLHGETIYQDTIKMPLNWSRLSYSFHAVDTSDNQIETLTRTIEILDRMDPIILGSNLKDTCETGGKLEFNIEVTDNIGVSKAVLHYWFGDVGPEMEEMDLIGGSYSSILDIPEDSLDKLSYYIEVFDTSLNTCSTSINEVIVVDTIPPSITGLDDISIYAGEGIDIRLEANDNIGIHEYSWLGSPIDSSEDRLIGNPEEFGEYPIQVVVKDGSGNMNSTSFLLVVLSRNHDDDGDGIPDLIEMKYGLDPVDASDGTDDLDNDGLTNFEEFINGTILDDEDSDDDGYLDGYEVKNGFDPLDPLSGADLDVSENGKRSSGKIIVIILISVLLIVVGSIFTLLFMKKRSKSDHRSNGQLKNHVKLEGPSMDQDISPAISNQQLADQAKISTSDHVPSSVPTLPAAENDIDQGF